MQQNQVEVKFSNKYLNILFSICFISGLFGGTIAIIMSSYLPVAMKEILGNENEEKIQNISALINAMFIYGWMFGGIFWGIVCDRLSRKNALVFSMAFYSLFAILTSFAVNWQFVLFCRFLSGFGVGGVIVAATILISESWNEKSRSVAIGFFTICFPVGIFLAGLITYLIPSWRTAFLIGFLPLFLSIIAYFLLKEPVNWKKETISIYIKISELFNNTNRYNLFVGTVTFGAMLIGLWAVFSWLPTWIQSILTKSDGQKEIGIAMMAIAGAGLVGGSFSGWFTLKLGKRKALLMCFAVCFMVSLVLFKLTHSFSPLIYLEVALLGFFFGASQGVLSDFISKIFPASIRATATGFCFNAGRLFTATAVFFIGSLVNILGGYGNSIFTFSLIFVVGFIATSIFKEKSIDDSVV